MEGVQLVLFLGGTTSFRRNRQASSLSLTGSMVDWCVKINFYTLSVWYSVVLWPLWSEQESTRAPKSSHFYSWEPSSGAHEAQALVTVAELTSSGFPCGCRNILSLSEMKRGAKMSNEYRENWVKWMLTEKKGKLRACSNEGTHGEL